MRSNKCVMLNELFICTGHGEVDCVYCYNKNNSNERKICEFMGSSIDIQWLSALEDNGERAIECHNQEARFYAARESVEYGKRYLDRYK